MKFILGSTACSTRGSSMVLSSSSKPKDSLRDLTCCLAELRSPLNCVSSSLINRSPLATCCPVLTAMSLTIPPSRFCITCNLLEAITFPCPRVTSSSSAVEAHTKNSKKKVKIIYKIRSGFGVANRVFILEKMVISCASSIILFSLSIIRLVF